MQLRRFLTQLPGRVAAGAFVLHSGLEKWKGDEQTAAGIHGMATGAYPVFAKMKPAAFLRLLAVGEITTGSLLLLPFVPRGLAGAALTGFSGALIGMYLRTPGLHQEGSVWPTPNGLAVSKDVWMLGIGSGLLLDGLLPGRD